jgi:peptidyl-prolyl cis-trans isomerase C
MSTDTRATTTDAVEAEQPAAERGRLRLPQSRKRRALLAVALILLVVIGGVLPLLASGKQVLGLRAGVGPLSFLPDWLPDGVAFRYQDRDVTVEELDSQVRMLGVLYGVKVPAKKAALNDFRRDAAKAYAVSLVLEGAADEHRVAVSDKQARDTLTAFLEQRVGTGPQAYSQFTDTLAAAGGSERMVLDEIKRRLEVAALFNKVSADVPKVTEAGVRKAFEQRKGQLGKPETRHLRNIVLGDRDTAGKVVAQLRAGASFAPLAKRVSLDGSTRENGGDLGDVARKDLDDGYGKLAFAAKPGALFGPVKTEHGWNVGKVLAVHRPAPARFSDVSKDLAETLRVERAVDAWRNWMGERLRSQDVAYADEYRPDDPHALPGPDFDELGVTAPSPPGGGK